MSKDHKTAFALAVLAAVAAVLVANTAAVGTGHMALAAANGNKTKGDNDKGRDNANSGFSIPTNTKEHQECQTAGGASPISASCTAVSTNVISNLGGLLSETHK